MNEDAIRERYELLCDSVNQEEAAAAADRIRGGYYRTRSIRSGSLLEVQAYPMPARREARALRNMNVSSEAQKKLNQRNAERKLVRLAEANFTEADYYFTGTLEGPQLPDIDGMQALVRAFIRRWRRARAKAGLSKGKYIYVIEGYEEGDRKKRLHFHALMEGGIDRAEIKRMWERGRSSCDELDPRGNEGLIPLARYLSKDPRGKRRWAASKGLKQPEVRIADRKLSARAAKRVAQDVAGRAAALEKIYQGYELIDCEVRSNPYIAGVFVYAVLRRKEQPPCRK